MNHSVIEDDFATNLHADSDANRPLAPSWENYSIDVMDEWKVLLESNPEEDEVHSFLALHPALIPGGSGDIGPGGHHGSDLGIVFTEPELRGTGESFLPDFMWVTRSSGVITPILIEIEKPSKRWFRKDGRPTADFTCAKDQLNEWRAWFEDPINVESFKKRFLLVDDRFPGRPLEPQFLLIYGRAKEFTPGGGHSKPEKLIKKRDSQKASAETLRTFDSLYPNYNHRHSITAKMTPGGILPFAFSPVYGTGPTLIEHILEIGDPSSALHRSVMMTSERKEYLSTRWKFWADVALDRDENPQRRYVMGTTRE